MFYFSTFFELLLFRFQLFRKQLNDNLTMFVKDIIIKLYRFIKLIHFILSQTKKSITSLNFNTPKTISYCIIWSLTLTLISLSVILRFRRFTFYGLKYVLYSVYTYYNA